ncbi:MAG TPA: helix-turn-helix domain-containing protein, partial [Candidatus Paceibacterota bacterium]|nr:helix-turn-helix domain-containing protein [Candidatus Paceibacterota bacterium]
MDLLLEKNLISTKSASSLSGYSADYLSRLVRAGKIVGVKVGRAWYVDTISLASFIEAQDKKKADRFRQLSQERIQEYSASREVAALPSSYPVTDAGSPSAHAFTPRTTRSSSFITSQFVAVAATAFVMVLGVGIAESKALENLATTAGSLALDASHGFTELAGSFTLPQPVKITRTPFAVATSTVAPVMFPSILAVYTFGDALPASAVSQTRAAPIAVASVSNYSFSGVHIGAAALSLGTYLRDTIAHAPHALLTADLTFARTLVDGSHTILATYARGAGAYAAAAPAIPQKTVLALYTLGTTAAHATDGAPLALTHAAHSAGTGVLALARGVVSQEIAFGTVLSSTAQSSARIAIQPFVNAGVVAYRASSAADTAGASVAHTGRALATVTSGLVTAPAKVAQGTTALPAAVGGESFGSSVLASISSIASHLLSAGAHTLAFLLEPIPPTAHAPEVTPGVAPIASAASTSTVAVAAPSYVGPRTVYYTNQITMNGVSQAYVESYVDTRIENLTALMYQNLNSSVDSFPRTSRASSHSVTTSGGSGSVTSVDASGGTTGLSFTGGPITSSGTLTLAGTLAVANGGTGLASAPTYGQVLVGDGSGG